MDRRLEGTIVSFKSYVRNFEKIFGIVLKAHVHSGVQYYETFWFDTSTISFVFTEQDFYNTDDPNMPTMWHTELVGNATDQDRLAFRIKNGI
jgi:hypothetical protein